MSQVNQEQLEWMNSQAAKFNRCVDRGSKILENIPELLKKKLGDKLPPEALAALEVNSRIQARRFTKVQAAAMIGISKTALYNAEQNGRLPPPDIRSDTKKKVAAGYTINQINHARDVFGTRPCKPHGSPAAILGSLNLKGGARKTTEVQLLAHYSAGLGFKVLVVDTDPQGTLSFYFGKRPDIDVYDHHTMAPYMLDDKACLVENGFSDDAYKTLDYAVQNTYWDDIDIIPASMSNLTIDLLMQSVMTKAGLSQAQVAAKLRNGLEGLSEKYDLILIDGTPSLNISTINVVAACDLVFVPTPASMPDFASTLQFTDLLAGTVEHYIETGHFLNVPDVRYVVTKYSKRNSYCEFMEEVIRMTYEDEPGDVLKPTANESVEVGKAANKFLSIYEVNPNESDNRAALKTTIEDFNHLFDEMLSITRAEVWHGEQGDNNVSEMIDELSSALNEQGE